MRNRSWAFETVGSWFTSRKLVAVMAFSQLTPGHIHPDDSNLPCFSLQMPQIKKLHLFDFGEKLNNLTQRIRVWYSVGQWLNFKLFGITYLVGKISRSHFYFRLPFANWGYIYLHLTNIKQLNVGGRLWLVTMVDLSTHKCPENSSHSLVECIWLKWILRWNLKSLLMEEILHHLGWLKPYR